MSNHKETEHETVDIDVRLDGDTVWLSRNQIADLPGRDKSTISRHIANVFAEGELTRNSVVAEFATPAAAGKTYQVEHFNLDVIISVGYRVKSRQDTQFRYDPKAGASASATFFKSVQNKLRYAAHGKTAAEVIARRADAGKPFMGLLSFAGSQLTKVEAGNAKNYLDANELKRLNTLVSAYFDAAEFRAMGHETTYMQDWLAHLEQLIAAMSGKALQGARKVTHQQALAYAEAEYAKFRTQLATQPSEVETDYLETVRAVQRKITRKQKP